MKRNDLIYVLFVLQTFYFFGCSPKTYEKMAYQPHGITVDGEIADWGGMLRFYDKEAMLFYEVRSDENNLYVAFAAYDQAAQMSILTKGISIGIDTVKGGDYPVSVLYPLMEKRSNEMPPKQFNQDSLSRKMPIPKGDSQMKLAGFNKTVPESVISSKNRYGIEAAMGQGKENELYCELKLPFSSFYSESGLKPDTASPLFFKIHLDAVARPMGERGQGGFPGGGERPEGGGQQGGGAPPQGMGGSDGGFGGQQGGGRPPMGEMSSEQSSETEIKFELRPSYQ